MPEASAYGTKMPEASAYGPKMPEASAYGPKMPEASAYGSVQESPNLELLSLIILTLTPGQVIIYAIRPSMLAGW